MKHVVLVLVAVQLLLCAAQSIASITSTDIAQKDSDHDPTLLEKTWTVTAVALDRLEIQVAGNVFVDYDASLQSGDSEDVVKVVMRASTPQLLDAVDVSVIGDDKFGVDSGVRLHYKNRYTHVKGLVVTHILLSKPNALRTVSASIAQNVVLEDDVVVQQNPEARLHFSLHGDGHIFVGSSTSSKFDVRSLGIAISGHGGVQFQAWALHVAEEAVVSLVGSGHAAVLVNGEVSVNKVESAIAGKGRVIFQTPSLQTIALSTEIIGDGEATYTTSGICVDEKIHLVGDGTVNAGSIVCKNADVVILGIGEAVVQATDRLSTMLLLTGSVKYVNERPKSIESSGIVLDSSVKPAEVVPVKEFTPVSPPSRVASGVFLTVEQANNNDSPYVHARPMIETAMRLQTLSAYLPESFSAFVLFEGIVGMALAAFAAFKFQQRRIRNKYQQLLP